MSQRPQSTVYKYFAEFADKVNAYKGGAMVQSILINKYTVKVSELFDNDTFHYIVESFNNEGVTLSLYKSEHIGGTTTNKETHLHSTQYTFKKFKYKQVKEFHESLHSLNNVFK